MNIAVIDAVVRSGALSVANERLRCELLERERALSLVQHSVATLQHRLSLLAAAATEPRPHAQLTAVNQIIHNIARQVRHGVSYLSLPPQPWDPMNAVFSQPFFCWQNSFKNLSADFREILAVSRLRIREELITFLK